MGSDRRLAWLDSDLAVSGDEVPPPYTPLTVSRSASNPGAAAEVGGFAVTMLDKAVQIAPTGLLGRCVRVSVCARACVCARVCLCVYGRPSVCVCGGGVDRVSALPQCYSVQRSSRTVVMVWRCADCRFRAGAKHGGCETRPFGLRAY